MGVTGDQSKIYAKITFQNKWGNTKSLWKNLERISNVSGFQFTFPTEQQQSTADIPIHLHCKTNNIHPEKSKDCISTLFTWNTEKNLFWLWKLKTTSKMTQPPRRKKISCLLLTGTWIPRSQVTFSSGSCNAAAREQQGEMHCWEPQLSNNLSAEPW